MAGKEKEPRNEFGKLLRRLRQAERLSQEEFALRLGVSNSTYGRYERGTQRPPISTLEAMAVAYGAKLAEWSAVAGYEVRPEEIPTVRDTEAGYLPRPSDARLRVAGRLRAGIMNMAEEETSEWFPCLQEHAAAADFVVRVEGDSLYPLVLPGDYIAIRKRTTASPGEIVVVRVGDEIMVKRYAGRSGGNIRLESINPTYPPIETEEAEIIGVFAWQHRTAETARRFGR